MPDPITPRYPSRLMLTDPVAYIGGLVLTAEEATELAEYMEHQYLNRNKHPALCKLIDRLIPKPEVGP